MSESKDDSCAVARKLCRGCLLRLGALGGVRAARMGIRIDRREELGISRWLDHPEEQEMDAEKGLPELGGSSIHQLELGPLTTEEAAGVVFSDEVLRRKIIYLLSGMVSLGDLVADLSEFSRVFQSRNLSCTPISHRDSLGVDHRVFYL